MQPIHIALWGSAEGCLRLALPDRPVVAFSDELSYGPLADLARPADLRRRMAWLQACFEECHLACHSDIAARQQGLAALLARLADGTPAILWVGECPNEQLMLRALSDFLPAETFVIDVSSLLASRAVATCPPASLAGVEVVRSRVRVDDALRQRWRSEWRHLLQEAGVLRLQRQARLQTVAAEYYDRQLLEACPTKYVSAFRVIGLVMAKAYADSPSDLYLDCRIRRLIDAGKLDTPDATAQMHGLLIKRAGT